MTELIFGYILMGLLMLADVSLIFIFCARKQKPGIVVTILIFLILLIISVLGFAYKTEKCPHCHKIIDVNESYCPYCEKEI